MTLGSWQGTKDCFLSFPSDPGYYIYPPLSSIFLLWYRSIYDGDLPSSCFNACGPMSPGKSFIYKGRGYQCGENVEFAKFLYPTLLTWKNHHRQHHSNGSNTFQNTSSSFIYTVSILFALSQIKKTMSNVEHRIKNPPYGVQNFSTRCARKEYLLLGFTKSI